MGLPWPSTALAASMPLNPFHTDSAHPPDGTFSPCISKNRSPDAIRGCFGLKGVIPDFIRATTVTTLHKCLGNRPIPVRRPSRGVAQQASRQDAEKAPMGQDVPSERACGVMPERGKSRAARPGCRGVFLCLAFFAPGGDPQAKKVGRPAGRNQSHQSAAI